MKISNEFTVHTPVDRAWAVLTDLAGIAPCLPGAQLTGVDGDVYRGKVKVKVGPVISEFAGTARFVEKDDAGHRAVIDAKGRDARSAGNASALITAELRPDGDATVVTVDTDLKISGKLAQFGSGMIKEVSSKLLGQFAESLEAKLGAGDPAGAPVAPVEAVSATAERVPAAAPEPANTGAAVAGPGGQTAAFATGVQPVVTATPEVGGPAAAVGASSRVPEEEPEPLDLIDLAGGSIRQRLVPLAIGLAVVAAAVVVFRIARR
ncbi:MAG TPA: SRPBCC domain-containing protein [Actinoplanes sp.]|nr:SRPBCC domain-containing protein [Actinoplanes sp.]